MIRFRTFTHPHGLTQRLAVADLLAGAGAALIAEADGPTDIVYSDPPWNPGNEKWWRRHAGVEPPERYEALLDAWCACVANLAPQHVFCEQSVNPRHRALFTDAVSRCDAWTLPLLEEWTVYYGSPGSRSCVRPNVLLHFGAQHLPTDPSGLRGEGMTRRVFEGLMMLGHTLPAHRGEIVDPCMGKGMTSRMAAEFGCDCLGTELNPKRLDYTIRWLMRHGYTETADVAT